jgi:hypothetical protein
MYFPLQPNMTELPAVVGMYCAQLIAVMLDSAFSVKGKPSNKIVVVFIYLDFYSMWEAATVFPLYSSSMATYLLIL